MKALVIYDSVYGNTEKIARAIAGVLGPPEDVQLVRASAAMPSLLAGVGLLIVGSPTQGGRPTRPVQDFMVKIPAGGLKGIRVAAFDTRIRGKGLGRRLLGVIGYAAGRIARALKAKGGELAAPPEGFFVKGNEGPLEDGEEARAATWAAALINKKDR